MIHPTEFFDTESLRLMSQALQAAANTVRLTGAEPDKGLELSMARRLIAAAATGERTLLSLTQAALGWELAQELS